MIHRMGAAVLSLAGIFVATYLWLFKLGKIGTIACGTGGCETVQLSRYSAFLGVDVALIGIVGYVVMLAVCLVGLQPAWADRREPAALLALLAGASVLFAVYLTYLELFVIHAICRWCVASAVIVVGLLVLALLDLRRFRRPERQQA
ncbi:MAG TPA: vitamin K epoxide reductase family protein [Gemmatimonadales bacterium]|nr:vitamin K epoxide reductase family protein [Gemmatimonadales bacterium]